MKLGVGVSPQPGHEVARMMHTQGHRTHTCEIPLRTFGLVTLKRGISARRHKIQGTEEMQQVAQEERAQLSREEVGRSTCGMRKRIATVLHNKGSPIKYQKYSPAFPFPSHLFPMAI